MSDLHAAELVLMPSRLRRRLLLAPLLASAALSVLMAGAGATAALLAAGACALAAALCLRALLRPEAQRRVRLGRDTPADHVSASRIVLRTSQGPVVVWRDAVDPDCFRRLAVAARWPARNGPR